MAMKCKNAGKVVLSGCMHAIISESLPVATRGSLCSVWMLEQTLEIFLGSRKTIALLTRLA
jgi:hypothetical protein